MQRTKTNGATTLILSAVTILAGVTGQAAAQCIGSEPHGAIDWDGDLTSNYGESIDTYGDRMVVGAPRDGENGTDAGAVFVYRQGTGEEPSWVEEGKLLAPDGRSGDQFGLSVAIEEEYLLIGAPFVDHEGNDTGAVYYYRFDGNEWYLMDRVTSFEPNSGDNFGYSVDISRNDAVPPWGTAIVGAPGRDAAYVHWGGANGFGFIQKLPGVLFSRFGTAVSMDHSRAVVGAPDALVGAPLERAGAAITYWCEENHPYLWHEGAWLSESAEGDEGDEFGASVSIEGNVVVVGNPFDDDLGTNSGSAYVYYDDGVGWGFDGKLLAHDGAPDDLFGISVATNGSHIVVGSHLDDTERGADSGSLHVFDRDGGWYEIAQIVPASGVEDGYFGFSAALDEFAAVGSPSSGGFAVGRAYEINFLGDCNGNGQLDLCEIINQTVTDCDGNRVVDQCEAGDCNGNGWSDVCDIVLGISQDCNDNAVPDECDIAEGTSQDCNSNGVPDECDLAEGTEDDCNGNGVPDSCDIAAGTSQDCNGNGVPDECDLAEGTEDDCNGNGVPDSCDIAIGTSEDCNGNGVPDSCDIASGTSDDVDGNGVPDECEGCFVAEVEKLLDEEGAEDAFGFSVAMDGDMAIVGSPIDDNENGTNAGAAIVLRYDGVAWQQQTRLIASDGASFDEFGWNVAISGDVALVAAPWNDHRADGSGAVYVFRYDGATWHEEAKLLAADGAEGDELGRGLAIDGDVALIGVALDDDVYDNAGSALVFRYDGASWNEEAKLLAPDARPDDYFGETVALDGDVALVGAPADDTERGSDAGAAWIFRFDGATWSPEQRLVDAGGSAGDAFASSVALDGDVIVIGIPGADTGEADTGAANVYRHQGGGVWEAEATLRGLGLVADARFGGSVALEGDVIVAGAPFDHVSGVRTGTAYPFVWDGTAWTQRARLVPSDGAWNHHFAYLHGTAIAEGRAILGAHWDDNENGTRAGAAYAFAGLGDCNTNGTLDLCDIANGTSEDANGNGTPDECDPTCPEDLTGDGFVTFEDVLVILAAWGNEGGPEDLDGSGTVDFADLLLVLAAWGACE